MTPKEIHEVEQGMASMKQNFCPAVRTMFDGFVEAGFVEEHAFDLTKTWMTVILTNPTAPPPRQEQA